MKIRELINNSVFKRKLLIWAIPTFIFFIAVLGSFYAGYRYLTTTKSKLSASLVSEADLKRQLESIASELESLKNQDQYLINQELEEEITNIQKTYQQAVQTYEDLLDLKSLTQKTDELDSLFAESLSLLSERNYASASAILTDLNKQVEEKRIQIIAALKEKEAAANLPQVNEPPASGYRRQQVSTPVGNFTVSIITADLNSARVIVDTASSSDCHNDCPVLPLADYIARNNAFAGINGAYFCPASYPSCADKKNAFDTLLMNKDKVYFNSANNVYSTVPAVIFKDNWARFVGQSLEWGRDTSVDAVLANYPLLVLNGNIHYTGDPEAKRSVKSGRSFVGATGATVYLGVVHSATSAEAAQAVHALGIQNALGLDSGGSTALWYSGYKVGPGRNLATALLLVRK